MRLKRGARPNNHWIDYRGALFSPHTQDLIAVMIFVRGKGKTDEFIDMVIKE